MLQKRHVCEKNIEELYSGDIIRVISETIGWNQRPTGIVSDVLRSVDGLFRNASILISP